MTPAAGTAVVLVDPALGEVVPAAAIPAFGTARAAFRAPGLDWTSVEPAPEPDALLALAQTGPVVLVTADLDDPAAAALHAAGVDIIGTQQVPGRGLLRAMAVMDRLRSPGGCPWDAEQTHESLRQYLIEECFELLEAIEDGNREALREELGDVLLQVLFHARMAEDDAADPFTVDDVAEALVDKLIGRHPHVFGEGDSRDNTVRDARTQERRWEELKRDEKRRESSVDGVALGQPALALAAKLAQCTARAGLPGDLLPRHTDTGSRLFDLAALAKLAGQDPEGELRAIARQFAQNVRTAEEAARSAGVDPFTMDHQDWRRFWPH
jgi:XTP/dITP diphosphohydrolase